MFGHDNDENKPDEEHKQDNQQSDDVVKPDDASTDDSWQHPGPPPADDEPDDSDNNDSDNNEAEDNKEPDTPPAPAGFSISQTSPEHPKESSDNDLIDLKQEALGKLSPLVGHLNQDPAEKFRTLMMMIQASDDQSMVREAYQTALKIDNEKERAQALLDIVNEINYFTQHGKDD